MVDANWANVVLLLDFEQSPTPVDLSNSTHSVTFSSSSASVSTAQKKFGASSMFASSVGNDGNRAQVWAPVANWQFGSGQFTVECWAYFTAAPGSNIWGLVTRFGGSSNLGWFLGPVSGNIAFYYSTTGSDNPNVGAVWTPLLNTWYHIAADRDASNELRVYVDGVVMAHSTVSSTFYNSTQTLCIGNDNNLNRSPAGYIDEVRITKGVARYGGAFTPPSAPFEKAVVTQADLIKLDLAFAGQPFCVIAKSSAVAFGTLDWAFNGQPLTPYTGGTPPSGGDMRATQVGAEAWVEGTPAMTVTQVGAEVWYATAVSMMVTQVGAEVWQSTAVLTPGGGGARRMLVQIL